MTTGAGAQLGLEPVAQLGAVRAEWTELAQRDTNVFGTWEWADCWHRLLHPESELALAILRRSSGEAVAILPVCIFRHRPVRILRLVGAGPSDQLGPVCAAADRPAAAAALRRHAEQLLASSGLFLAEHLSGEHQVASVIGAEAVRHAASPVLSTAGRSFEEFLTGRSRNFREQVRRRSRALERRGVEYRLTQDAGAVDADFQTLIRLHEERWSEGHSGAFSDRRAAFHREFARVAFERGWLRLWTMRIEDRPVAAWYGLRFGATELYYQAGRDPAYDRENVGFVLLCHSIKSAFADGVREYRFGTGEEPYKYRFAERDPGLETVALAAGVRGRLALAALRASLRGSGALRRAAKRLAA